MSGGLIFLAVLFFVIGALSFAVGGVYFYLYRTFEGKSDRIGKSTGLLRRTKYEKDVAVYGRRSFTGPVTVTFLKHRSRSVYEYTVNGKTYWIRYEEYVTSRQMPWCVPVVYLKRFPKIAYVNTEVNSHHFEIYALVASMIAVIWIVCGLAFLF